MLGSSEEYVPVRGMAENDFRLQAELKTNFRLNFSFFASLSTAEALRLNGTVGFVAIRDFSF